MAYHATASSAPPGPVSDTIHGEPTVEMVQYQPYFAVL